MERTIEAAGERLAYQRFGTGPDVVFIHGWPLHSETFRDIAQELAERFTCHLIDLPGAGRSPRSPQLAAGFRPLIDVLSAALDAMRLSRYALVAHDSGGILARHLAARDARVAGLVLGNTELPDEQPVSLRGLHLLSGLSIGPSLLRRLWRNAALCRSSLFGFGQVFADRDRITDDFFERYLRSITSSNAAMSEALLPIRDYGPNLLRELVSVHQRIRVPTQLIWGTDDRVFPLQGAERMRRQFGGGAELALIEGGKLFAHEEFPTRFAALAGDFLQRLG